MAAQCNAGKHSRDKWIAVLIALGGKKKKPYWLKSSGAIAANFSTALKFRVSWKLFGAADP